MSRTAQISLALVLAGAALALLGYSAYTARERVTALEAQIVTLETAVEAERELTRQAIERENDFYEALKSDLMRVRLETLVAAQSIEERENIADLIESELFGTLARYPDGYGVKLLLENMVSFDDVESRREALDNLLIAFTSPGFEPIVSGSVVSIETIEKTASRISALITTLGGVASGLISLFLVIMGRGKRRIEEEMLRVDLDLKNVELARARYDAREALVAMHEHRDRA